MKTRKNSLNFKNMLGDRKPGQHKARQTEDTVRLSSPRAQAFLRLPHFWNRPDSSYASLRYRRRVRV